MYIFIILYFLSSLFKYLSSCNGKNPRCEVDEVYHLIKRASVLVYQQRTSLPVFGFATFCLTHVAVFRAGRGVEPNAAGGKRTRGQGVIRDGNVARRPFRFFYPSPNDVCRTI